MPFEERKLKEIEHSDRRRSIVKGFEYKTDAAESDKKADLVSNPEEYEKHFSNMKFYSISHASFAYRDKRLFDGIAGKQCLDYCCGNGEVAVQMAAHGAGRVLGIDISRVAIDNARDLAAREKVADRCEFRVMDAEHMEFPGSYFDVIQEYGALHHLDLKAAYAELARVLKPGGRLICTEALRHNPLIHAYRKRTMHLRTQWEFEHILGVPEIKMGLDYFEAVDIRFFHLLSLAAVPLRKTFFFNAILKSLELLDEVLLRLPLVQRWAWVAVVVFSKPRKKAG